MSPWLTNRNWRVTPSRHVRMPLIRAWTYRSAAPGTTADASLLTCQHECLVGL